MRMSYFASILFLKVFARCPFLKVFVRVFFDEVVVGFSPPPLILSGGVGSAHGIPSVIERLLGELLTARPADPLPFLQEVLRRMEAAAHPDPPEGPSGPRSDGGMASPLNPGHPLPAGISDAQGGRLPELIKRHRNRLGGPTSLADWQSGCTQHPDPQPE